MNLIHGDCYTIIPTLEDNSVDLVITDPPFEFSNKGGSLYKDTVRAETLNELEKLNCCEFKPEDFLDLLLPKMKFFYGYFFCNKMLVDQYIVWAKKHNFKFDILTMCKSNPVPAKNGHHLNDLEYIILIRDNGTYFAKDAMYDDYRKSYVTSCHKRIHPAEKPVELLERFVRVSCPKGGLILDPFMGSASTGIAALKNGCDFIGIEKNEKWFELSKNRIDEYNGKGGLFEGIA